MSLALSVTQPAPACSEHELVAAVRRGEDRAFEELYSRYRRRIGSYVLGMVGDHGRAEDVTQDVFMSALRRIRDSERPIAFKPWIYEIARNACIDEFRRSKRTQEVPLDGDDTFETAAAGRVPFGPKPTDAVENRQQIDDLRGAFKGLSESHHKLLVMRELEGRSYAEIGAQLGMSRPVVESTLFRARRKLSEEYEELVTGRRCEQVQMAIAAGNARAVQSLGIRERRRLARHLSHCQPCRRHARLAGADESLFHTSSIAAKLAALFPFPLLRWRRAGGDENAIAGSGSHSLTAIQSLQAVDPSGPLSGLGRVAAAAATLVIAGTGTGLVTGLPAKHHRAAPAKSAAPISPASPSRSTATPKPPPTATGATRAPASKLPAAAVPGAGTAAAVPGGTAATPAAPSWPAPQAPSAGISGGAGSPTSQSSSVPRGKPTAPIHEAGTPSAPSTGSGAGHSPLSGILPAVGSATSLGGSGSAASTPPAVPGIPGVGQLSSVVPPQLPPIGLPGTTGQGGSPNGSAHPSGGPPGHPVAKAVASVVGTVNSLVGH
jgi:RNA polymerase sigma factor (sigma-70 family)